MRITRSVTLALAMAPLMANAATAPSMDDRLRTLEERQQQLEQMLRDRDAQLEQSNARIQQLESAAKPAAAASAIPPASTATAAAMNESPAAPAVALDHAADEVDGKMSRQPLPAPWGTYEGGKGVVLARNEMGEVNFSAFAYVRYLNQKGLDETYTDAFGRTSTLNLRQDIQLQKVLLNFKGWLFDPDFRYLFYTWTANTSQGQGAQVVVAGNLSYRFNDAFSLAAGIGGLPGTRTTNYTFPGWLKVDHRTMADDYFRPSYTTGAWAWGQLRDDVRYRVMVGNNLSQLGVSATQLDSTLNTVSGALLWMPTTGEYGPGESFGDFEQHSEVATLFGVNYTRSREDAQGQPGTEDFANTQLRLSDGTLIFQDDPFGTGTQIRKATYQMAAMNAGAKYDGYSLDLEIYWRKLDDFVATGALPRDSFDDTGFQLQASAMLVPRTLQGYVAGSMINGQYGDPWDMSVGLNWFPMRRRELRLNTQALYLEDSPVGSSGVPFIVGANGWVFSTDIMLNF
jgi:hypothetical protein